MVRFSITRYKWMNNAVICHHICYKYSVSGGQFNALKPIPALPGRLPWPIPALPGQQRLENVLGNCLGFSLCS